MNTGARIVITLDGKKATPALIAKELVKASRNRSQIRCQVPLCLLQACLRLSSPYCYRHALLSSPELLVGEICRINSEADALQDVIEKLTKQIDGLKKKRKRK